MVQLSLWELFEHDKLVARSNPNELLLHHGLSPLISLIFLGKLKSITLVKSAGRLEAFEGPKMD